VYSDCVTNILEKMHTFSTDRN